MKTKINIHLLSRDCLSSLIGVWCAIVSHLSYMNGESMSSELDSVLKELSKKIIDYTSHAESPEGKVGSLENPRELSRLFELNTDEGQGLQGLLRSTDLLLQHSVVTWHSAFLEKLYAGTNPVGVASDLLLSVLNTNSHVFTASPALTTIERYISRRYANMFGLDGNQAGGLTFPGGSYSNLTSMHMARALRFPEIKSIGNAGMKLAVFTSSHSHYSVDQAAILLGLGTDAVFKVAVTKTGEMDMDDLERKIADARRDGWTPFYLNGTAGTTVYGSFDDLETAASVAQREGMWFHVDGSWGGNVVFSPKYRMKLRGIHLAQSITVNPHKMLGVPCTCSFLLVPDIKVFTKANSLKAPYLFHSADEDDNWDLADGTMGCGRRSDALKLYLGWQWYGTEGYGKRVDHAFEMTQYLAEKIKEAPDFYLISEYPPPLLQTCFYYTPNNHLGDKSENSKITRHVVRKLLEDSKYLIDFSSDAKHGDFFRVVVNAPTVTKKLLDDLIVTIRQSAPPS